MKQTGQIYTAKHFHARELCSEENHLKNSFLCAGKGIIGPISDLHNVSKREVDARQESDKLQDDARFENAQWEKDINLREHENKLRGEHPAEKSYKSL